MKAWRFWGLLACGWVACASARWFVGFGDAGDWWKSVALMPFALGAMWFIGMAVLAGGWWWSELSETSRIAPMLAKAASRKKPSGGDVDQQAWALALLRAHDANLELTEDGRRQLRKMGVELEDE